MPNTRAKPTKCTRRASACKASPRGVAVPISGESSRVEYGFALDRPTTNRKAPREGCVSAARICQLTTYVPVSEDLSAADSTEPLAVAGAATWLPVGLNTLMPAPAGVTGSLKIKVTVVGTDCSTESGAGSD